MKKVLVQQSHNNYPTVEIRAEVPMLVKPIILKEYWYDGTRMYKGVDGKTYIADVLDKMFSPAVKLKVLPERNKGQNADPGNRWQKE